MSVALALAGCGDPPLRDPPPAPTIRASCAIQPDNALRADCAVTVSPPGPVAITFAPAAGGPERTQRSDAVAAEHALGLWRATPATPYAFTATATTSGATTTGTFTTGPLPPGADVRVDPAGAAPDDLLFGLRCDGAYAVVVDAGGTPVWYQALAGDLPGEHEMQAVAFTGRGELVALIDRERIRRFALDGRLLQDLARDEASGFDGWVHHDVFEREGLLYVVTARPYAIGDETWMLDGVTVLDRGGHVVAEWEVRDHVLPTGPAPPSAYWEELFPGALDGSHGNAVWVAEDLGFFLFSSYRWSTVLAARGDPGDPAFGELLWVLDGAGGSPLPPTLAVVDPQGLVPDPGFAFQHHPTLEPDGTLLLFDNGVPPEPSRVLALALDEAAGEAAIRGAWPLPLSCPILGSVFPLSTGDLLATCGPSALVVEIARATGAIRGERTLTCADGTPAAIARAIPVAL